MLKKTINGFWFDTATTRKMHVGLLNGSMKIHVLSFIFEITILVFFLTQVEVFFYK